VPYNGGYIGWVCVESPESNFEDKVWVDVPSESCRVRLPMDARFTECCEPGSVQVVSVVLNGPGYQPGATTDEHGQVWLEWGSEQRQATKALVTFCGVRLGHGERWRSYSRKQFEKNRDFWASLKAE
jgi:hypothetical protein